MYQTANKVIIQESDDVVTVHPSAIHNVNNLGVNLAEDLNFLPSSKFYLIYILTKLMKLLKVTIENQI